MSKIEPRPELGIALTAAIMVRAGSTAVADAALRRKQYLDAARFYAQYAPVYFLEHSGYDLSSDRDFAEIGGIRLRAIDPPDRDDRGKGYREFHGLDSWYATERAPPRRLLKITGRYVVVNIRTILGECQAAGEDTLLFDRYRSDRIAITGVFSVPWEGYGRYLHGAYREMDDDANAWAEHVVYRILDAPGIRCKAFWHEPDIMGISGSSNTEMRVSGLKYQFKQAARTASLVVDRRFLMLRGRQLHKIKRLFP